MSSVNKNVMLSKKQGGGKKAQWNGLPNSEEQTFSLDAKDPNFDSEEEEEEENGLILGEEEEENGQFVNKTQKLMRSAEFQLQPTPQLKQQIQQILQEFFHSRDFQEVDRCISELDCELYHFEVVKRGITMSLDRHEKERELVSRLFCELTCISPSAIALGFKRVLPLCEDLTLDHPNAKAILATFVARAIVDELLPPKFLEQEYILENAGDVAAEAIKKLSINHGTARMEKGWGPGDGRPVSELKVSIDQLTREYLLSRDLTEAGRCVRELNVSHFHHEVVKRGIINALDQGVVNCEAMSALLAYLSREEIVSPGQMRKGFEKVQHSLSDLRLDIPTADATFATFVEQGKKDAILPADFSV